MKELMERLQKIATDNDDEFRCCIHVDLRKGVLRYSFECCETADGHQFLGGSGETIEEAVASAFKNLDAALEEWGYE